MSIVYIDGNYYAAADIECDLNLGLFDAGDVINVKGIELVVLEVRGASLLCRIAGSTKLIMLSKPYTMIREECLAESLLRAFVKI